MSTPDDNTIVRYSVKELFARIDGKLDALASVLDAKADHVALLAIEARVDALEKYRDERSGSTSTQKATIAILIAILGMLVPVVLHVT